MTITVQLTVLPTVGDVKNSDSAELGCSSMVDGPNHFVCRLSAIVYFL